MKWTTEQPTQPGYYWTFHDEQIMNVYVADCGGWRGQKFTVHVEDQNWLLSDFTHWIGPLPVPDPPKETV